MSRLGLAAAVFLSCCLASLPQTQAHADDAPTMRILKTKSGTRFGLFGNRPDSPQATFFVFATDIEGMGRQPIYTEAARRLAKQGWLYVTLDPPCHGRDAKEGEPSTLSGWAHRVTNKQDLMRPFVDRCRDVLEWLIAEKYTDPLRVAAGGTSRGGLCALHFTAAEPRVRAVVGVSPVTNLLTLREFKGVTPEQVARVNASSLADRLAGRAIWMSIGNHDQRVGTDDCIAASRRFIQAARKKRPNAVASIELVVAPSKGHTAIENAYSLAAEFILKRFETK